MHYATQVKQLQPVCVNALCFFTPRVAIRRAVIAQSIHFILQLHLLLSEHKNFVLLTRDLLLQFDLSQLHEFRLAHQLSLLDFDFINYHFFFLELLARDLKLLGEKSNLVPHSLARDFAHLGGLDRVNFHFGS